VDPLPDPLPEPLVDPLAEPLPDPLVEPLPEPLVDPLPDPLVEPLPDPLRDPLPDPLVEPLPEPLVEPLPLPLVEPELQFNLFDVLDQLSEAERITVAMGLMQSLTTRAPELERTIASLHAELDKRETDYLASIGQHLAELDRLRVELKNERSSNMLLRQELESKRVSVARTIEKIITVDSGRTMPSGGDWGHEGRGRVGAASGPRGAMHRKPLQGHVPRVVREHLANGHKPEVAK